MDTEVNYELFRYRGDPLKAHDAGKPDSALIVIADIVRKEPGLKYAPLIANHTFASLLKTDMHAAYEYGKLAIATPTYEEAPYAFIIGNIQWYADKLILPAEIYRLGAEAYQLEIAHVPYPEIASLYKDYYEMAEWYWLAEEKAKAKEAMQKAIEELKSKKNYSATDLDKYEYRLREYLK